MRISDWSSDVCSSDLTWGTPFTGRPPRAGITRLCCRMLRCRKPRPGEARVPAPARCRGRRGPRKTVQAQERAGSGSAVAFEQFAPDQHEPDLVDAGADGMELEIGRAPGRERVCM